MKLPTAKPLTLSVDTHHSVSALWQPAKSARACFVMAHGAGAGMRHPFLESVATGLAMRAIATLRYQFPYVERGSRRTDPPKICHATVRAAVAEATRCTSVPLIAGGRSFGARMTSQAQAESALPDVRGLAFLGFPLHPAKRPSDDRAKHLSAIQVPMLFLQGTRDDLASMTLLESVTDRLGKYATLSLVDGANHAFHVPVRSGRNDAAVLTEMIDVLAQWIGSVID